MLKIWISGDERADLDEGWVARRVAGLRQDREPICVRVTVKDEGVDLVLSAGACPTSGAGGRQPTPRGSTY